MDKKKEILFNLNNFLLSFSSAFDFIENEQYHTTLNHSKKVAFIAIKLAQEFNYQAEGLADICSYALLHNIGLLESKNKNKEYCLLGDKYSSIFPFLTEEKQIIKYHCEHYDGSGIFGLKGEEIPLFSQFIAFADIIDTKFNLSKEGVSNRQNIIEYVKANENKLFSTDIVEVFIEFSAIESFWLDLQNEQEMLTYIFSSLFDYSAPVVFEKIFEYTNLFNKILNKNSKIIEYSSKMADFYKFDHKDKQTFLIAASLANIGKFFIPKNILNKITPLNQDEFTIIKSYPYHTKKVLSNIIGFSDISNWATKVQESLDGSGYPFSLEGKDLSLKDRLLTVLNIYTSLLEKKPYRNSFTKEESFLILEEMAKENKIDKTIVKDLRIEFF